MYICPTILNYYRLKIIDWFEILFKYMVYSIFFLPCLGLAFGQILSMCYLLGCLSMIYFCFNFISISVYMLQGNMFSRLTLSCLVR